MNEFRIYDKDIFFVGSKKRKINSVGVISYYFVRLTQTSIRPIEVCAIKLGDNLDFFSRALNSLKLEEDDEYAYYLNSISFNKSVVASKIDEIKNTQMANPTKDIIKEVFGIDLDIEAIDGLEFDRIIYTEGFDISNTDLKADGYIFVFSDIASKSAKYGFFAGNVRNMTYNEYVDKLNEYGASTILNNISIEQKDNQVTISNNTPFHIEITPYQSKYSVEAKLYGKKIYTRSKEAMDTIVLRPFSSFTLHHDLPQKTMTYNLLNNVIADAYINEPFSNEDEVYLDQKWLIQTLPYEFELKRVGLEVDLVDDIENFFVATGFSPISSLGDMAYSILHKENPNKVSISSDYGEISFNVDNLSYLVTPKGLKEQLIKGLASTMKIKIDSSQYFFNYTLDKSEIIITEIAFKNAFNNVMAEYMPSLLVKASILNDYTDFQNQNTKIKIDKVVYNVDHSELPYLLKTDVFKSSMFFVDLNDISDMAARKSYHQYIFKTYVKELDDVIEEFIEKRKRALGAYKFINIPFEVSSAYLSEIAPGNSMWDVSSKEHNDFAYNVKEHLADLGYEIALEEALKRLKRTLYFFKPQKEVLSTIVFGITLDKKWYFLGSNWYRAEEIDNPKITTYLKDKVKSYNLTLDHKFMYEKKVFFGYDNSTEEAVVYAKALAIALSTNTPVPSDLLAQNPALSYVISHSLETERTYPDFKEVIAFAQEFTDKYTEKELKNKYIFPNIFQESLNTKFLPGLYSQRRAKELKTLISSNALDVLDNIVDMQIATDVFLAFDDKPLKKLAQLINASKYSILGIEDRAHSLNEIVEFKLSTIENKIINGYLYDLGIEIYIANKLRFGLYYSIFSKKVHMFIADEVVVRDYALMIAILDSMLHYNIDDIRGYEFKELGVYSPDVKELDNKYLYLPINRPVEKNYNLVAVSANYISKSIFIDFLTNKKQTFSYDLGEIETKNGYEKVKVDISMEVKGDNLVLTKNSHSVEIPLITLENMPFESMEYFGFQIKPYRLYRFLPFEKLSLKSILVKIEYNSKTLVEHIDFAHAKWIEIDDLRIMLGLDKRGLVYLRNIHNKITDFIEIMSIDEIFNNSTKDVGFKVSVLNYQGGKL